MSPSLPCTVSPPLPPPRLPHRTPRFPAERKSGWHGRTYVRPSSFAVRVSRSVFRYINRGCGPLTCFTRKRTPTDVIISTAVVRRREPNPPGTNGRQDVPRLLGKNEIFYSILINTKKKKLFYGFYILSESKNVLVIQRR